MYKKIIALGAILAVLFAVFAAKNKKVEPKVEPIVEVETPKEPEYIMDINSSINQELSSKANYDYGHGKEHELPKQCRIVHTETIQRHGARHVNKISKLDTVKEFFEGLQAEGILADDSIIDWVKELIESERNNTGTICKTGEYELKKIAQRLRKRIHLDDDPSGEIIVDTTYKERTQQSRDVFMESLLPPNYPKDQIQDRAATTCEILKHNETQMDQAWFDSYTPLRFFSVCTNYQAYRHDEMLMNTINENFQYNPEYENMMGSNSIWRAIFSSKKATDAQKVTALKHMYSLCQLEASCYNNYQRTCKLLVKEPAIFNQLGYFEDVLLFLLKGPANEINYRMACPLGRDVFGGLARFIYSNMQEGEEKTEFYSKYDDYFDLNQPDHSRLHMRFGHAESLLPLYDLFIMKPPRRPDNRINFTGESHVPMSANFQFDLVECDGKYYVRMLANEVIIPLDLPKQFDTMLFEVNGLLDQWMNILKDHGLGTCSMKDFVELCGDLTCNCFVCSKPFSMSGGSIFLVICIAVLCFYLFGYKYVKAWIDKQRHLSHLNNNLKALLKRKEDLISLFAWASECGENKEAKMIQADLEKVDQDIEHLTSTIESVKISSIIHPGYSSLCCVCLTNIFMSLQLLVF